MPFRKQSKSHLQHVSQSQFSIACETPPKRFVQKTKLISCSDIGIGQFSIWGLSWKNLYQNHKPYIAKYFRPWQLQLHFCKLCNYFSISLYLVSIYPFFAIFSSIFHDFYRYIAVSHPHYYRELNARVTPARRVLSYAVPVTTFSILVNIPKFLETEVS